MSTSTHTSTSTSSTASPTTGGQDKLRVARADQRRRRRAGGVRGVAGDAGHRREVPQLQRWQPAADRRAGPASHPGGRVPYLAERGPAGTQGGAGHRDPGAVHLPPKGGRPARASRTGRAGADFYLQRGSGARRRRQAGPGLPRGARVRATPDRGGAVARGRPEPAGRSGPGRAVGRSGRSGAWARLHGAPR